MVNSGTTETWRDRQAKDAAACASQPVRPAARHLRTAARMLMETSPYTQAEKHARGMVSDWLERMANGEV